MPKPRGALLSLFLLGVAGGCAGWTVQTELTPHAQLGRYRTYAWMVPPGISVDRLLDDRIRDQVAVELARKGIRPVSLQEQPDFLVEDRVEAGPRQQIVVNGDYGYAAIGASGASVIPPLPAVSTYTYTEQALIIDFIDARSNRIFWRGFASYVVNKPPEVSAPKAQQAVSKVLRKFPAARVANATRPSG